MNIKVAAFTVSEKSSKTSNKGTRNKTSSFSSTILMSGDANVTAIHKKEDKSVPSNYRPISLRSQLGKSK